MTPEQAFSLANMIAIGAWLLLAIVPNRRWATHTIAALAVPAIFAIGYGVILAARWVDSSGSFTTLGGVGQLFADPWLLLAGWLHYLAFDLLVGSWEARDAQSRGVSRIVLVPCLFLTFMFGPVGWMLYTALTRGREPRFTGA